MSQLAHTSEEDRATQYALRVLGYRARSVEEMRRRLERKGFSTALTDRTLAKLARLGLLDDAEFARGWVTSRPGCGPARLKQELRQKGISREIAEEIIGDLSTEDEMASAFAVAQRALRNRTTPPEREELLRVRRLLQRRGFGYEVVNRVCARLHEGLTAEGDWLE